VGSFYLRREVAFWAADFQVFGYCQYLGQMWRWANPLGDRSLSYLDRILALFHFKWSQVLH